VGAKEESSLEDFRLLHLSCMSRGPTCDSRAWLSSVYFGMCRCVLKRYRMRTEASCRNIRKYTHILTLPEWEYLKFRMTTRRVQLQPKRQTPSPLFQTPRHTHTHTHTQTTPSAYLSTPLLISFTISIASSAVCATKS
jgi:hypothetical protein